MKKTAKPKVSGYRLGKEIGRGGMFWKSNLITTYSRDLIG